MLTGAHVVIYSKDAEADRKFFRDILGFRSVDAGHDWLIFGLPAAELAFHPHDKNNQHEMYFVCDDLNTQMAALEEKGVRFGEIAEERWGTRTTISVARSGCMNRNIPSRLGRQAALSKPMPQECRSSYVQDNFHARFLALDEIFDGDPRTKLFNSCHRTTAENLIFRFTKSAGDHFQGLQKSSAANN